MQILNLRLVYFFLFVGIACFAFPVTLAQTTFGRFFLAGISLFWAGRTIEQAIFLRAPNKLVHVLTAIFILGAVLFALPLLKGWRHS